jgi:hypothetical protein
MLYHKEIIFTRECQIEKSMCKFYIIFQININIISPHSYFQTFFCHLPKKKHSLSLYHKETIFMCECQMEKKNLCAVLHSFGRLASIKCFERKFMEALKMEL